MTTWTGPNASCFPDKAKVSTILDRTFLPGPESCLKTYGAPCIISQKTLDNLSKSSLHILSKYPLSFNLSLYSHSIIQIILTHDHLGMNFTFVLVSHCVLSRFIQVFIVVGMYNFDWTNDK